MSEILDKLATCEKITEWVDPHDERLVRATGEPAPNAGGGVREEWVVDGSSQIEQLEKGVSRLLIPELIAVRGLVKVSTNLERGAVVFNFEDKEDWSKCFPINEKTLIFSRRGKNAWAAVALGGAVLGLAVFSKELDKGIEARVQPVPDEVFAKIIA